jgi:hypothetical protein
MATRLVKHIKRKILPQRLPQKVFYASISAIGLTADKVAWLGGLLDLKKSRKTQTAHY